MHAIALTCTSLYWPKGKNKQPVNLSFKQFAISHYPDSRGPLCFSLPPLQCANRERRIKVPVSLAEPSLANNPELSSQQPYKSKCTRTKALFRQICHRTELLILFCTKSSKLQNNSLRQDTCKKIIAFNNVQDNALQLSTQEPQRAQCS